MNLSTMDTEQTPVQIGNRYFINELGEWKSLSSSEEKKFGIERGPFSGEREIALTAHDLVYAANPVFRKQGKILCNHIFFRADPRKVTGIMGPSGSGKTTLLYLLSGYIHSRYNKGQVFAIEEFSKYRFDIHQYRRVLGGIIGYVPQDDTLIPWLTVRESLEFCLRLQYPEVDSIAPDLKTYLIKEACRNAGLCKDNDDRLEELLKKSIGSPENKILSGGERKRVNIAHELIRSPLLLFLDEPTSGLSSVDADEVLTTLKNLCQEAHQMTIILTIHQPSKASFECLDNLLILNLQGNIAYFGAMKDAVAYFAHVVTEQSQKNPKEDPGGFILDILNKWTRTNGIEHIVKTYRQSPHYFPFFTPEKHPEKELWYFSVTIDDCLKAIAQLKGTGKISQEIEEHVQQYVVEKKEAQEREIFWRQSLVEFLTIAIGKTAEYEPDNSLVEETLKNGHPVKIAGLRSSDNPKNFFRRSASFFHQFCVIFTRNIAVAKADKNNRRFQLLQPIVIGLLMLLSFAWYSQDYYSEDILSKVGYEFTQRWRQGGTIVVKNELPAAKRHAFDTTTLISEGSANRRAAVFFLLSASCIWFGIINACREIVDELAVLKREAKSTLHLSSYLAAKTVFLIVTCCKQVLILLFIVFLPNMLLSVKDYLPATIKNILLTGELLKDTNLLSLSMILCLTTIFASWIGLFISAIAPSQRFALTAVPLVIIPQLLFGGLIRPIKDIDLSQSFMITERSLSQLRQSHLADDEPLPQDLIEKLALIKDQRFTTEEDFVFAIEMATKTEPGNEVKSMLVKSSVVQGFCPSLITILHDMMLQKWTFQSLLLYDSLGDTGVLRRMLDINRRDKYEYIQFEPVKLIELFFNVDEDSPEKKMLYMAILPGILLVFTYGWLIKKVLYSER